MPPTSTKGAVFQRKLARAERKAERQGQRLAGKADHYRAQAAEWRLAAAEAAVPAARDAMNQQAVRFEELAALAVHSEAMDPAGVTGTEAAS